MRWKMHRNSRDEQETPFPTPNSSSFPQQPCFPLNDFHLQTENGKTRILGEKLGRSGRCTSNQPEKRLMCPELPWEPKINSNLIALRRPNPMSIPPSNELHIRVQQFSKLYTDDTGKFPVRSLTDNQYIMVAYHCDSKAILVVSFTLRKYQHRLQAYDKIMQQLTDRGMIVDLQI